MIAALRVRARYLAVGGLCASTNWALMLLIDRDRYLLSSAISFLVVGALAYQLHARWTFAAPRSWSAYRRYLGGMLSGYVVSLGLLFLLRDVAGVDLVHAIPTTTLAMLAVNFVLTRWALVARRSLPSGRQASG